MWAYSHSLFNKCVFYSPVLYFLNYYYYISVRILNNNLWFFALRLFLYERNQLKFEYSIWFSKFKKRKKKPVNELVHKANLSVERPIPSNVHVKKACLFHNKILNISFISVSFIFFVVRSFNSTFVVLVISWPLRNEKLITVKIEWFIQPEMVSFKNILYIILYVLIKQVCEPFNGSLS